MDTKKRLTTYFKGPALSVRVFSLKICLEYFVCLYCVDENKRTVAVALSYDFYNVRSEQCAKPAQIYTYFQDTRPLRIS